MNKNKVKYTLNKTSFTGRMLYFFNMFILRIISLARAMLTAKNGRISIKKTIFLALTIISSIALLIAVTNAALITDTDSAAYFSSGTVAQTNITASPGNITLTNSSTTAYFSPGNFTSTIFDSGSTSATWNNISWIEEIPYGEELPNNGIDEIANGLPGGANMSGNVLLMHFNNVSSYGENESNVTDFSGRNNHGTPSNSTGATVPRTNTTDKVFGAASKTFDGVNDFLSAGSSTSLDLTNKFTILLWFKPASLTQTNTYLVSKPDNAGTSNSYDVIWEYVDNTVEFHASGFTGSDPRTGSGILISDTYWHNIVYSYDGSTWAGYRDGLNIFSVSRTFSLATSTKNLFIGNFDGVQFNFGGSIDEVAIWNRTLTNAEIRNHYLRGALNLTFQVRSCDDSACVGEEFVGPNRNISQAEIMSVSGENLTGLVALYHFNNQSNLGENESNITDSSGRNNHGISYGTSVPRTNTIDKMFGTASKTFDGSNDYINVSNEGNFDFEYTNPFSFEAWARSNDVTGGSQGIVVKQNGVTNGISLQFQSSKARFYLLAGGAVCPELNSQNILSNTWYHITGTSDGSTLRLYVDGIRVASAAITCASSILTDYMVTIGNIPVGGYTTYPLNGNIDEVAIWNRTLTAAEILNHYNRGVSQRKSFTNSTFNSLSNISSNRWFQYNAYFTTQNTGYTPVLKEVNINYNTGFTNNETISSSAIVTGIQNVIPAATIYANQQAYIVNSSGSQVLGRFDRVAAFGNQRWAFNYINTGESYTNMKGLGNTLYIWENSSLLEAQITQQVQDLINKTKV
ncbi:LamG domain-containing protein [Candidatus Woesearchaeota archaeon]|nr:LamG domain-containing protein [Candidatus Woesearchaeota archaeon]